MILLIHHRVRDFDAWKRVFDEHQDLRERHATVRHWVYRSTEDRNEVVVSNEFRSTEDARGLVDDPSLREAMEEAGVEGQPMIVFLEEVESIDYAGAVR